MIKEILRRREWGHGELRLALIRHGSKNLRTGDLTPRGGVGALSFGRELRGIPLHIEAGSAKRVVQTARFIQLGAGKRNLVVKYSDELGFQGVFLDANRSTFLTDIDKSLDEVRARRGSFRSFAQYRARLEEVEHTNLMRWFEKPTTRIDDYTASPQEVATHMARILAQSLVSDAQDSSQSNNLMLYITSEFQVASVIYFLTRKRDANGMIVGGPKVMEELGRIAPLEGPIIAQVPNSEAPFAVFIRDQKLELDLEEMRSLAGLHS